MRDEANNGLLGIVSEGTDYTIDLGLALAGDRDHLRLLPIAGAGALQNAEDVIFVRGIDFAIVQTDVLDDIRRNPPFPGVEKYLQYITKLYDQELQVLASPDIQSIDDLRGKKVNFGLRSGGTYVTAAAIFKAMGIEPTVTTYPQPLALDKLREPTFRSDHRRNGPELYCSNDNFRRLSGARSKRGTSQDYRGRDSSLGL